MPLLLAVVQIANHKSIYLPALHGCWSPQHWYCPLPGSCPHTCTATGPL